MISIAQLILPVVVAAVAVFVASSLIHMVLKYHNRDFRKLGNEDELRQVLRKSGDAPGMYAIPHCADMKDMGNPDMQRKFVEGPVGFFTLRPSGAPNIGTHLAKWFGLNLLVAVAAAHLAWAALPAAADGPRVFHFTGLVALVAYGAGSLSDGIWKSEPRAVVAKNLLDALIYAVVTGLAFAWLWPH